MSSNTPGRTVYHEVTREVNHETGEIKISNERKVIKKNSTPEFVMLFTQTAPMLAAADLTKTQAQTLFAIISKFVGRNNLLTLNTATKEYISAEHDIKFNTVDQNVRALIKKDIILKERVGQRGVQYYLNPYIFGKGNWADIEQLRYTVDVQYDFNKLEYSKQETTAFSTGMGDVTPESYQIEESSSSVDQEGIRHEEVVLVPKQAITGSSNVTDTEVVESEIQTHKNQLSLDLTQKTEEGVGQESKDKSMAKKLEALANLSEDQINKLLRIADAL